MDGPVDRCRPGCGETADPCAQAVHALWRQPPVDRAAGPCGAGIPSTACGPEKVRPDVYDADGATVIRTDRDPAAPARPRDPAPRGAGLRRPRRRAALPARRLGHRRAPGHPRAGRAGHRRDGPGDGGLAVRLPRLRHDGRGRPPGRRRRPARGPRPGRGRPVARRGARRGPGARRARRGRAAGGRVRPHRRDGRARPDLPAHLARRPPADARRARRHRRAPRDAGHPHPARRGLHRCGRERGAQRPAGLRRRPGRRRLRAGHRHRPGGHGRSLPRRRRARRPTPPARRCGPTCPASGPPPLPGCR